MSAILRPEEISPNEPGTLGGLLYADRTQPRVPEADWVELVRGIAARDTMALHHLYGRAHRIVYTLAMRITGNAQTAEEVAVDTFHDVWQRAAAYDAEAATVVGWIMNLARSRAIDRVRFEARKKRVNPLPDDPLAQPDVADASAGFELAQMQGVLRAGLANLSAGERVAIELAFFAEMTHAEIAAHVREPLGTIKTRIRSGLTKLRRALGSTESLP